MAAKLEEFEKAVYGRKRVDRIAENDKAVTALLQCLTSLRDGSGFEGRPISTPDLMTRLASAVIALLCDPQFKFTQAGFDVLCAEKAVIDTAFIASAYQNSDFVYSLVQEDEEGVSKYLLLFSPLSKLDLDLETVFRKDPQATFGLWLSLLGYAHVFTKESDARREHLMTLAPLFEGVMPSSCLFNTFCGAYMHVSYGHGEHKHDVKRSLHKIMAKILPRERPRFKIEKKAKPTIFVLNEWWWTKHAMYRSYANSIKQLRKEFYLIGACPGDNADQESKDIFDEWIDIKSEKMVLNQVADQIEALKPDIIYYPSIGMAIWSIAMASLRLAPIQVMTYGHPATSNSPEIDYGLIEEDCYIKECFSEKIIPLPNNSVRPTEHERCESKHKPKKTDRIRIGIAAMQVKISWPFIQAMREVQKRSSKPVDFWFLSAASGIGLYSMASELGKVLQNVTIQEKQIYAHYLEALSECDIALFSFPFGGANSMYDALAVGIPMVSLEGLQPHSRSDASIIRRCGLPESLITHTPEEYVEAILRLTDDEERASVAEQVRAVDLSGFYVPDTSDAFLKAFLQIYHENTIEKAA